MRVKLRMMAFGESLCERSLELATVSSVSSHKLGYETPRSDSGVDAHEATRFLRWRIVAWQGGGEWGRFTN